VSDTAASVSGTVLVSVVVCTHNREADLERCLEALARLEDGVEVIVVDSASSPPCAPLVERYGGRIDRLRSLREERPGLSRARNRGLEAASSEIVAFVDDDAAPRPDWARRLAAPFHADPEIGCVGGACVPTFPDGERPSWLSDRLLQFAGITRFGSTAREARSSAEWPFGANVAFRAEALRAAGGFAENLGRTGAALLSGEDSAVVEALRRDGWKVWLEPTAIVDHAVHAERCTSWYYWRRLWWAGVTRAQHGDRARRVLPRLLAAAPIRLALYAATRDRVHLYRTAETAGYLARLTGLTGR